MEKKSNQISFTAEEIRSSFMLWRSHSTQFQPDHTVIGQLAYARTLLHISATRAAEKLKITQPAYSQFERSERSGRINLETLRRAADALDCELKYEIRPKSHPDFFSATWEKFLPDALNHPWMKCCDPERKTVALVSVMKELTKKSLFY